MNTAQVTADRAAPNAGKGRARCVASGRSSLIRLRPQAAWDFACRMAGRAQLFRWGSIDCRRGRDLLFGSLAIDEAACQAPRRGTATVLQSATERAYRELFGCIEAAGYPHLVRVWNYLPRINAIEGGIERYRQFNIARQEAFLAANRSLTGMVPGACALGSSAGSLTIGFLAARQPRPVARESPPGQRLPLPGGLWSAQPDLCAGRPARPCPRAAAADLRNRGDRRSPQHAPR